MTGLEEDGEDFVEHVWTWDAHEFLEDRNQALPDTGLPSATLTRFFDNSKAFGGSGGKHSEPLLGVPSTTRCKLCCYVKFGNSGKRKL